MNFIERQDNLLTKKECSDIIQWVRKNKLIYPDENKDNYTGYDFCDLMHVGENFEKCFSPVPLRPAYRAINTLRDSYAKNFSEVCNLHDWDLEYVRFKWWKPGGCYSAWHSEHMPHTSKRVLSFLIYLSDNNSYTEFKRYRNVQTKAGRGILFPAYFTHEHRGSVCKNGLDRYIISGYYGFN